MSFHRQFRPGQPVIDRDNSFTGDIAVVVEYAGTRAGETTVVREGDEITVAELNPGYPETDEVVVVCFKNALDAAYGSRWWSHALTLAEFLRENPSAPRSYSYPESRLIPALE